MTKSHPSESIIIMHCFLTPMHEKKALFSAIFHNLMQQTLIAIVNRQMVQAMQIGTMFWCIFKHSMNSKLRDSKGINEMMTLIANSTYKYKGVQNMMVSINDSLSHLFCDYSSDCKLYTMDSHNHMRNIFKLIEEYRNVICHCNYNSYMKGLPCRMPSTVEIWKQPSKGLWDWSITSANFPIVRLQCFNTIKKRNFQIGDIATNKADIEMDNISSSILNRLIKRMHGKYHPYTLTYTYSAGLAYLKTLGKFDDWKIDSIKTFDLVFNNLNKSNICKLDSDNMCYENTCTCDFLQPFLFYAMFLFHVKSQKACKYFEFCLGIRPLSGYLHFQYALYLFHIIKDYKLSYYHLSMAKKLGPNVYTLDGKFVMYKCDVYPIIPEKFFQSGQAISQYENELKQMTRLLCLKLNKQHTCDSMVCNKIMNQNQVCKGCKSAFYCSKKCQKYDWKVRHRKICVSKFIKPLSQTEKYGVLQRECMLHELLKQIHD